MSNAATTPFLVHRIVQVCGSCRSRYTHYLPKPLESKDHRELETP